MEIVSTLLYFLTILFVVVLCSLVCWWFYFTSTRFYKLGSKIPGPRPLPIIGNLNHFLVTQDKLLKRYYQFAKQNICSLWAGPWLFVCISDPEDIKIILYSHKTISKGSIFRKMMESGLGRNNLFVADRTPWSRLRKIINPYFSHQVSKTFINVFDEMSLKLITKLKLLADGTQFDILEYMQVTMMETLEHTQLGKRSSTSEKNLIEVIHVLKKDKPLGIGGFIAAISIQLFRQVIYLVLIRKKAAIVDTYIRGLINDCIEHYRKDTLLIDNKNDETSSKCFERGFLDNEAQKIVAGNGLLTLEELMIQAKILLLAAKDTSALTVSACVKLLGIYPAVLSKVKAEIVGVFGSDSSRSVTYEDLKQICYLDQVIKETLRLYPPGVLMMRNADEEIKLTNYVVPKDATILINAGIVHRDPTIYPDPDKFDPDRFSPDNNHNRHPCSFIPFLAGPRVCPGRDFSMLQMKTVIINIIRHFEILPCGIQEDMEELKYEYVTSLKNGYKVRVKCRV